MEELSSLPVFLYMPQRPLIPLLIFPYENLQLNQTHERDRKKTLALESEMIIKLTIIYWPFDSELLTKSLWCSMLSSKAGDNDMYFSSLQGDLTDLVYVKCSA